jgi:hypothetical protein
LIFALISQIKAAQLLHPNMYARVMTLSIPQACA